MRGFRPDGGACFLALCPAHFAPPFLLPCMRAHQMQASPGAGGTNAAKHPPSLPTLSTHETLRRTAARPTSTPFSSTCRIHTAALPGPTRPRPATSCRASWRTCVSVFDGVTRWSSLTSGCAACSAILSSALSPARAHMHPLSSHGMAFLTALSLLLNHAGTTCRAPVFRPSHPSSDHWPALPGRPDEDRGGDGHHDDAGVQTAGQAGAEKGRKSQIEGVDTSPHSPLMSAPAPLTPSFSPHASHHVRTHSRPCPSPARWRRTTSWTSLAMNLVWNRRPTTSSLFRARRPSRSLQRPRRRLCPWTRRSRSTRSAAMRRKPVLSQGATKWVAPCPHLSLLRILLLRRLALGVAPFLRTALLRMGRPP